eukprot:GFUD01004554.1.p2 GENE.GFUD01004554.1~~GFUD01004554.1.p2  ORF type:complete len:105 (-),score=20.12 GFUD01004554.1:17-331(-)
MVRGCQGNPVEYVVPRGHPHKYADMPYLMAGTQDIHTSRGKQSLRNAGCIKENAKSSNQVWTEHPEDKLFSNSIDNQSVTETNPVTEGSSCISTKRYEDEYVSC